jgi:hypothetical protein
MEDFVNSLDATYVNGMGEIEKWSRVDKPMVRQMIENDLRIMRETFETSFGESLLTEKENVAATI